MYFCRTLRYIFIMAQTTFVLHVCASLFVCQCVWLACHLRYVGAAVFVIRRCLSVNLKGNVCNYTQMPSLSVFELRAGERGGYFSVSAFASLTSCHSGEFCAHLHVCVRGTWRKIRRRQPGPCIVLYIPSLPSLMWDLMHDWITVGLSG